MFSRKLEDDSDDFITFFIVSIMCIMGILGGIITIGRQTDSTSNNYTVKQCDQTFVHLHKLKPPSTYITTEGKEITFVGNFIEIKE